MQEIDLVLLHTEYKMDCSFPLLLILVSELCGQFLWLPSLLVNTYSDSSSFSIIWPLDPPVIFPPITLTAKNLSDRLLKYATQAL